MRVDQFLDVLDNRGYGLSTSTARRLISRNQMADELLATPVVWNERLRTVAGKAFSRRSGKPVRIELNQRLHSEGWHEISRTFMHELAHLLNPHEHHGPSWRHDAFMLGETEVTHSLRSMKHDSRRKLKVIAMCVECGKQFHMKNFLARNKTWFHKGCGGKVEDIRMLDPQRNALVQAFVLMEAKDDERLKAIRSDKQIGRGTGSIADGLKDYEIISRLNAEHIDKPVFARSYYRKMDNITKR